MEYPHEIGTIFALAMMSGMGFLKYKRMDSLERDIQESVEDALQDQTLRELVGEWSLRWGVGIYSRDREGLVMADNAALLARCEESPERYVLSIAGTNPISRYGWRVEDFAVDRQERWAYGGGLLRKKPAVALGTRRGFDHVRRMRSGGIELVDGLRNAVQEDNGPDMEELIVTGHSLGGTLTPVVASWLHETRDEWSRGRPVRIFGYSFAGATPGNPAFARYIDRLGRRRDFTFHRIWNRYDIVPYAWDADLLFRIPDIYEPEIPSTRLVRTLTAWAIRQTRDMTYRHPAGTAEPIQSHGQAEKSGGSAFASGGEGDSGTETESWWHELLESFGRDDPDSMSGKIREVADTVQYLARVSAEHSIAYFKLLGMEDILSGFLRQSLFTRALAKERQDAIDFIRERLHLSSKEFGSRIDDLTARIERKFKEMLREDG
jgi:hypothetical protein